MTYLEYIYKRLVELRYSIIINREMQIAETQLQKFEVQKMWFDESIIDDTRVCTPVENMWKKEVAILKRQKGEI